jgi:hypothetical protein
MLTSNFKEDRDEPSYPTLPGFEAKPRKTLDKQPKNSYFGIINFL